MKKRKKEAARKKEHRRVKDTGVEANPQKREQKRKSAKRIQNEAKWGRKLRQAARAIEKRTVHYRGKMREQEEKWRRYDVNKPRSATKKKH